MKFSIKKSGPYIFPGLMVLGLALLNIFCQDHWLGSDMAAEMIFSKLLAQSKHLFATNQWYYSTEFRVLYTQLVMAPLFLICDNWHIIRMVTNILSYVLILVSWFYMMKPLKTDRRWTALGGAVLLLPFSETMMTHMQLGNTYMPHVILLLFYFGLFLRLVKKEDYTRARRWEMGIVYVVLAVVCGVSGVRYLLAMQCPLMLAAFLYLAGSEECRQFRKMFGTEQDWRVPFRGIWKNGRVSYFYFAFLGAVCGVLGYALNVLWVSRNYVFQTYESTNFIAVYQGIFWERVQNALGSLLMLFGYIPDKGFLSLRGIISVFSFVFIFIFGYCAVRMFRKSRGRRFFLLLFLGVSLAVNVFVFVFSSSTMVPRYYITILIFALPAIVFYLEGEAPALDRLVLGLVLAAGLLLGSAKVTLSFLTTDKNQDRRPVAAFLEEKGFEFGFATYWNANIMTELTDGRVEIANIQDPESLEYFKWSSPVKYYQEDYHQGPVFLLLTTEEATEYGKAKVLRAGEKLYEDDHYVVYLYGSREELMSHAEER